MTIVLCDPYIIDTWLDRGVSVPVTTDGHTSSKDEDRPAPPWYAKAFKVRSVVNASVFAVGIALTNVTFVSTGFGVADVIKVTESVAQYEPAFDEVPSGRWSALVALLRESTELPADDSRGDPDPLG